MASFKAAPVLELDGDLREQVADVDKMADLIEASGQSLRVKSWSSISIEEFMDIHIYTPLTKNLSMIFLTWTISITSTNQYITDHR